MVTAELLNFNDGQYVRIGGAIYPIPGLEFRYLADRFLQGFTDGTRNKITPAELADRAPSVPSRDGVSISGCTMAGSIDRFAEIEGLYLAPARTPAPERGLLFRILGI